MPIPGLFWRPSGAGPRNDRPWPLREGLLPCAGLGAGTSQDKIWDNFQVKAAGSFDEAFPRLNSLFKQAMKLSLGGNVRVLDIGVGNGRLERRCMKQGFEAHTLDPSAATVAGRVSEGIAAKAGYSKNIRFNHLRQWLRWILGRLGSRLVYSSLFFVAIK